MSARSGRSIELLLTACSADLHSEVVNCSPAKLDEPLMKVLRTYCDGFWCHWIPRTIYREQTWYATLGIVCGIFGLMDRTARQGCTVIVPFREEMAKRHLKVSGDLGRVIFMVWKTRSLGEPLADISALGI